MTTLKNFLAGLIDISFFLVATYLILKIGNDNKISIGIIKFISGVVTLIYLGVIPYFFNNRTLGEILVGTNARIKIPKYFENEKEWYRKFLIIFGNRIINLLFDIVGINIIKKVLIKLKLISDT